MDKALVTHLLQKKRKQKRIKNQFAHRLNRERLNSLVIGDDSTFNGGVNKNADKVKTGFEIFGLAVVVPVFIHHFLRG